MSTTDAVEYDVAVRLAGLRLHYASTFSVGEEVQVRSTRYHGEGRIVRKTYYDSHIVYLDHTGVNLAVEIPNGNVWFYRAMDVYHCNPDPTPTGSP